MKYIDADKLKELLKERQEEKDYREVIWLIDSLQQEQSMEGLKEAAKRYGFEEYRRRCEGGEYTTSEDIFIAGAEWGAEHLKK